MMNLEHILNRVDEQDKEVQLEEVTGLDKKGQDFNYLYVIFYHFISIIICNIII